jgi:hypothetical protein
MNQATTHKENVKQFIYKNYCTIILGVCTAVSGLIAIAEKIISLFKIDTSSVIIFNAPLNAVLEDARLFFIYTAAVALVAVLVELRSRLKTIEKGAPKSFTNLYEATRNIQENIKTAAYKNNTNNRAGDLVIKVYGRRHRQIIRIIMQALKEIKGKSLPARKIIIYLYFSNPDFLESLKHFNKDSKFAEMIDEQKRLTKRSMESLMDEVKEYDFVTVKIKKHFDTPQFWAIQIDNQDIFWGYFMRTENKDRDIISIQGSPNSCFHFDSKGSELDDFLVWINNIFERLDDWSEESEEEMGKRA